MHLEVDKTTWGSLSKKKFFLKAAPFIEGQVTALSAGKRGGPPFF
jgi:hypothetical protein